MDDNRAAIRSVIRNNKEAAKSCFEKALTREPSLKGKIVLDIIVDDQGTASKVFVNQKNTTLKEKEFQACMVEGFKGLRFPAPPQGKEIKISYPFVFDPPN